MSTSSHTGTGCIARGLMCTLLSCEAHYVNRQPVASTCERLLYLEFDFLGRHEAMPRGVVLDESNTRVNVNCACGDDVHRRLV